MRKFRHMKRINLYFDPDKILRLQRGNCDMFSNDVILMRAHLCEAKESSDLTLITVGRISGKSVKHGFCF